MECITVGVKFHLQAQASWTNSYTPKEATNFSNYRIEVLWVIIQKYNVITCYVQTLNPIIR